MPAGSLLPVVVRTKGGAMIGPVPLRIASALFLVLSLIFAYFAFQLGFWRRGIPGSGLLPFVGAIALLGCSVTLFFAKLAPEDETGFDPRALMALPVLCLYALSVPHTGLVP